MNKIAIAAVIAVALICTGAAMAFALMQSENGKEKIAVTMPWEKTLVESIAGDDYAVATDFVSIMFSFLSSNLMVKT